MKDSGEEGGGGDGGGEGGTGEKISKSEKDQVGF